MSTPLARRTARPEITGQAREVGVPSARRCFAFLVGIKVSLLILGFGRTYRIIARLTRSKDAAVGGCTVAVNATAERVAIAAAFFPGRALCLEQSLAIYFLLRRMSLQATLQLGVQAYPFAAHAWVEHAGEPVNESREKLKSLVPLPELPKT